MDQEESNLLSVIARYGQVNESRDGCDLGEGGATQGLGEMVRLEEKRGCPTPWLAQCP